MNADGTVHRQVPVKISVLQLADFVARDRTSRIRTCFRSRQRPADALPDLWGAAPQAWAMISGEIVRRA
jgi:hypothetical protein